MSAAVRLAVALAALGASATVFADPDASVASATGRRLDVYLVSSADLYLSAARTVGGIGGGFGVRSTLRDRFVLQGDLAYLTYLGNAGSLRVGAGVQRSGLWTPCVLLTASALFGDQLRFLTPEHPSAIGFPAFSLGAVIAPLRFSTSAAQVSLLEVGAGFGWDFPGAAAEYHLTLVQVSARL